jgi:indole-3-glycerol phosphate synthase
MSVLESIISGVREDEERRKKSKEHLAQMLKDVPKVRSAHEALLRNKFSVIAEVKRSSPSKGDLAKIPNPVQLARTYAEGGAAIVSVLTEERRFKGSLVDFQAVRSAMDVPMLRKDFIVSEYLVEESRAYGADLILLIVAALDDHQLKSFSEIASGLGMDVLVEIHDEVELERAMAINPNMIGVNARNLKTLEVDQRSFERLLPQIPSGILRIAESGMSSKADVSLAIDFGADAILVGEALVRAENPKHLIDEFLSCARQS